MDQRANSKRELLKNGLKVITAGAVGAIGAKAEAATNTPPYYPVTGPESAAKVTVINYQYPPGYVDRYGTNKTPGMTPMRAAFQAAINQARHGGTKICWGATYQYLVEGELDCTYQANQIQYGLLFDGSDCSQSLDGNPGATPGILAGFSGFTSTGHLFDLTDCSYHEFRNVSIGTAKGYAPLTCFFQARNTPNGGSIHGPRFYNVRVSGNFLVAIQYNFGAEDGEYVGCFWFNNSRSAGTAVCYLTANNRASLKSTFAPFVSGSASCIDHQYIGGQFCNSAGQSTSDVFYFDGVSDVKILGPWVDCAYSPSGGTPSPGRAFFYCDMAYGPSNNITLFGITGENTSIRATTPVCFSAPGGTTPSQTTAVSWRIDASYLANSSYAVYAPAGVTLDNFHFKQLSEYAPYGIYIGGSVQTSTFDVGAMPITIVGTSSNNCLIGLSENWKIPHRNNDYWIDTGTGNKTAAIDTSALKVSGSLNVSRFKYIIHGPLVTVNIVLGATSSLSCPAGTALTGLPLAASDYSAGVTVMSLATNEVLGAGYVSGKSIILPAISNTAMVVITGTYFAA